VLALEMESMDVIVDIEALENDEQALGKLD
jgi:hypothetical protein